MPFIVTDIQNNRYWIESNRNRIELQACESKSNWIVKFVSIPSPTFYHTVPIAIPPSR